MTTSIAVVPTPNPDAMMFKVPEALVSAGTYEGKRGEDLSALPLAQKILEVEGTELVLIAPRFVTVRKHPDADWMGLRPLLVPLLIRFIEDGEMAVFEESQSSQYTPESEVEQRILALLDEEIRPAIATDGGDVDLLGLRRRHCDHPADWRMWRLPIFIDHTQNGY